MMWWTLFNKIIFSREIINESGLKFINKPRLSLSLILYQKEVATNYIESKIDYHNYISFIRKTPKKQLLVSSEKY
jgi:hypothetical protein